MNNEHTWNCKKFIELTNKELYTILQLRSEIFVVEQNCVFQDMDDKDQQSYHLMCWHERQLIAYTRLIPAGIAYDAPSIGRVMVKKAFRNTGTGKELMQKSIEKVYELFGKCSIKMGTQLYLKNFYATFGFNQCSEIYDEDGIDHIKMLKEYH